MKRKVNTWIVPLNASCICLWSICLQLQSAIGQESRWILAPGEMTIPLIPSKTRLAAFAAYTRCFMIPLNSELLSCFPALWGGCTKALPAKRRVPSTAAPGAGVSFWAPFFLPAPLQPDKQRGNKVSAGMPGSRSGCRAQSSAHPAQSPIGDRLWSPAASASPASCLRGRSENVNKHPNERKLLGCN